MELRAATSELSKDIWIDDASTFDREETEAYIKSKSLEEQASPNPNVEYLNNTIFPLLKQAIVDMLFKVKEDNSFYKRTSTFNGLDYLSEFLYNMNPNHPERRLQWTYIFDMQWVADHLKEKPRPCYAFHLIWSRDFAALKIQSYMRGHWVRCTPNIQELRQFWKSMREERRWSDNASSVFSSLM